MPSARRRSERVMYTVPWHPDFAEMPGWLINAIRAACLVIFEVGGLLPPLDELAAGIERYTGVQLDVQAVSGLCAVLAEFEFITRVGNAPGGSA